MKQCIAIFFTAATALLSQQAPRVQVGPLPDGGFLLSSGWRIKAAGTQIPVDTFPMAAAVTPDKKFLLVLNGGYDAPSISVIDIASGKATGKAPVPDAWLGLTINKAGDRVYVGGGARAAVYEFALKDGVLTPSRMFPVVAEKDRKPEDFIGDVQLAPDGHLLYAANVFRDSVAVVNPQSGLVISTIKTGRRPYRILFHPSGKTLYVSSWADGAIGEFDPNTGMQTASLRVGAHTTDMVWRDGSVEEHPEFTGRLFVSAGNTNNVYVMSANETGNLASFETINLAYTPGQPLGTTPSGLGLSADGKMLFIACSDLNAAAVVDISGPRSSVIGFVPSGWYPTAAVGLPDGRLGVLSGKGPRSYPNPKGPNPLAAGNDSPEYVARLQTGSVEFVDASNPAQLESYTREVIGNTPYRDESRGAVAASSDNPIHPNGPIKHVIYVVKEGRTYDQVLGDVKGGNGDASLTVFGEKSTPNLHKIARDFVLLDNFYVNADTGADGLNWTTAAIAPDFTQRLWPSANAGRAKLPDFDDGEPANSPPAGYLWSNAAQAGITVRSYGFFTENLAKPEPDGTQIAGWHDPILARYANPNYRGFDPDYPDVDRAKVFLADLATFEKSGTMPQLMMLRLGNDRTSGMAAGKISPASAVADNDQAVGMLVEGVSKSRFWNETAIFIVESDAANGADHVDSHRSTAFVVSPWVRRHSVDGGFFNQTSVVRTIESLLGMRPMTTYDGGAAPMFSVFGTTAAEGTYVLEKPQVPLDARNPATRP